MVLLSTVGRLSLSYILLLSDQLLDTSERAASELIVVTLFPEIIVVC